MRLRFISAIAAAAALTLTACGSSSSSTTVENQALNDYVAAEESTVEDLLASDLGSFYNAIDVAGEATADAVRTTFTYTYAAEQPANAGDGMDAQIDTFVSMWESQIFPAMEQYGLEGVLQGEYVYNNPDGSNVWSQVFMQDADGVVCSFDSVPLADSPTSCADVQ